MKKLLSCLPILFISNYLFAQSNACTTPTSIAVNTTCITTNGTLVGATYTTIAGACGAGTPAGNRNDVWYIFTAPATNPLITIAGAVANPRFQVYTNNCTTPVSMYCSNSGSEAVNGLTPGTQYLLRVYSNTNSSAAFTICLVAPAPAPANNTCAAATAITPVTACGAITGQSLFFADATGSPTSTFGTTNDVWYSFTVPASVNTVRIDATGLGGSLNNNNTFIEAFNASSCASVSTATLIGGSSRGGSGGTNTGLSIINLTPGSTYYFRVFTTAGPTSGPSTNWTFSICVSYSTAIPANNDCSGAVTLTPGTTNTAGTVANATASTGIPLGCAAGTPDDDVWYRFTAVRTYATVSVNPGTALNASGAMLQAFSSSNNTCTGTFTSIGCGQDAVNMTGLTIGNTYFIRVYTAGATGTGAIARRYNGPIFNISVTPAVETNVEAGRMREIYQKTNFSSDNMLSDPWEVTYGPDNFLWVTESKGYKLFRMDPNTGAKTTVLDISEGSTFLPLADRTFNAQYNHTINGAQGGFAGLAIHPKFLDAVTPKNYIYVSYIYRYNTTLPGNNGAFFTNSVVRFTYNTGTGKLESPVALCDTLPGSGDHNSQRMIIAPVGGTDYLFYAAGDMGAGQFANQFRIMKAQIPAAYEGKILRFNLESDGDAGLSAWIPNSNPYSSTSAVWSIGIRNNQGFAYDPATNILYGSSHGPYSDDEINIIESGKNYGHPHVIGYASDGNYNGITAGTAPNMTGGAGGSSCPTILNENTYATSTIGASYKDPLFSAYAGATGDVINLWNTTTGGNAAWPSEGWSGLDLYTNKLIPGWKQSLVAAGLKWGRLIRLKLGASGTITLPSNHPTNNAGDTITYFQSTNRYRDLAFAPNGKDLYLIMDRSAATSGPSTGSPIVPACPGCLQKLTFLGYNDDGTGKSTIPASIDVTTAATNFVCNAGTSVTIDNTNNNLWVPITGPDGNILAEIKANGNNLGLVTSSFYQNAGAIRVRNSNRYLDRNITITPTVQPSSAVNIRLYLTAAEYNALDADPLSGVSAIGDLKILKNNDACAAAVASNTTLINPTFTLAHGAGGYMLQGNVNSFSSFYIGSSNITLPLQLIYFTGTLKNNATWLNWETENEKNVSSFVVERGIDGRNFSSIGTVAAIGNTTSKSQYAYTDYDVTKQSSPVVYYRLRMIDIDGSFTYSQVVAISLADITGRVYVFPNPASQKVTVSINAPVNGKVIWKLTDNTGRIVLQNTDLLRQGNNNLQIDVNRLQSGLYYLTVAGAGIDQKVKLQKL